MTQTPTQSAETQALTISGRVSDQTIATIVEQVYRHFGGRDWLFDLDRVVPGADSRYFVPQDWDDYANAVVATMIEQLPNPMRDGDLNDGIPLEDLRARFDELDALPKEWWREGHPMSEFLREHCDEFVELSAFFKTYGREAERLGLSALYEEYCLEDLAMNYLRNEYAIDLDDFPGFLRDAIDDERIQQGFLRRCCLSVELGGLTFILASDG
jgi:hypothetical protein